MPSAAWIAASKKTPMQPVFYAACESVEAINVEQKLASDWNAGTIDNLDVFTREDGVVGVRNKLYTYNHTQVTWHDLDVHLNSASSPWFSAPTDGYAESITALWRIVFPRATLGILAAVETALGWSGSVTDGSGYVWWSATTPVPQIKRMLGLGLFAAASPVPAGTDILSAYNGYGSVTYGGVTANVYPVDDANFSVEFRAKTGTITTKAFDLGIVPNVNSRVLIDDMVTGASSIIYVAEGSTTGTDGWVSLGTITDGREIAPYRYYRFQITFVSTGYDTPELYSIRVVGGDKQVVHIGTHRGEPALSSGEVAPYLQKVSNISSKIALRDKPTVGDLTLDLAWMPLTSDLVQSTGKRRSVTVYLGFVGLPLADYEPYFTGVWESYTADQEKRTFTVKLRDVWKRFKKKIPDLQNNAGVQVNTYHQFGEAPSGTGDPLNIIDAMVQVADMAKAPDRFIDRAAFSALKAAHYTGAEWNVYRVLTDQKDSDDLLKELAVTAGIFLVPAPNGKLTPYHYDTVAAAVPTVTLDAAQIKFSNLVPDMAETVTRHNIFFNLIEDSQGRRSGGTPSDYSHVYTTVGSTNSVIAERDREEVITGEWFDNWGLAAGVANGVPNPLTRLADRLESWYTPIATVNGKQVATTKVTVRAENVPLRYYSEVTPGKTVYVDNLRLPCPTSSWGGFSDQVKFLVLGWVVDQKNYTLTLDLFQITSLEYNQNPTWSTYSRLDLFPPVTGLSLAATVIFGADGISRPGLAVSFVPPAGYTAGAYEVWVSAGGGTPTVYTAIPAAQAGSTVYLTIPVTAGADYTVSVVTIAGSGARPAFQDAPAATATAGSVAEISSQTLQMLNTEATSEMIDDYFAGKTSLISILDTRNMLFELGVVGPGVAATYTEALSQAASEMNLNKNLLQSLNSMVSGLITSEYSDTTTYTVGQFVKAADGNTYQCILETTGHAPPNATYWLLTSDLVSMVNEIQQDLDAATATWTSTAQQLTADLRALDGAGTGRVTIAETEIEQNAANITLTGTAITGPLAFVAGAVVEPGVQVEGVADVTGLEVQVSRTRIDLDSANAAITLGASRLDSLAGRMSAAEIEIDGANASILLQAGEIDAMDGRVSTAEVAIDGANAAIALRATSAALSAEVDVLSDMIGLKLDAGPISAGLAISWTDETHTRSNITAYADTFRFAKPDGTGPVSIVLIGEVDGVEQVGINGNLVVDGTVSARMMAADVFVGGNFSGETFTGNTFQTAESGERFVVSATDNLAHFWGDRGDGTIEEIATIGAATSGGDRRGVYAQVSYGPKGTNPNPFQYGAVEGKNTAVRTGATAVLGTSDSMPAVGGFSSTGDGVLACSTSGYSINAYNGRKWGAGQADNKAPLRLQPSDSSSAPTHLADIGALWVTSAGILYINKGAYTWEKVGAQ